MQLFYMFCFDAFTAAVDYAVAKILFRSPQAKHYQQKIEQAEEQEVRGVANHNSEMNIRTANGKSSNFEEGEEQIEKAQLEYWKFAKRQMGLFTNLGLAWGIVSTIYGAAAHYLLIKFTSLRTIFDVECEASDPSVWEPHGLPAELYIGAHMLLTMLYITLYYVLYWIIPYAYNQIAKTDKELENERKEGRQSGRRSAHSAERSRTSIRAHPILKTS
jgi:hypothetical protein